MWHVLKGKGIYNISAQTLMHTDILNQYLNIDNEKVIFDDFITIIYFIMVIYDNK